MGCDIHMVVELKHDGEWIGLHTFPHLRVHKEGPEGLGWTNYIATDRNYDLFAALAAVRGAGPAPLGIPDDISALGIWAIGTWGEDGHSHTYWPAKEAGVLFLSHHGDGGKLVEPDVVNEICKMFGLSGPEDLANARLIIWFDN